MHGHRTPTPPSSQQQPSTPRAPYMYSQPLPPSPVTPSGRFLSAAPPTPYMGTVALPSTSHGLMTPPHSPEKARGYRGTLVAPPLSREHCGLMTPVLLTRPPAFKPEFARQAATEPPMATIYIRTRGCTFTIQGGEGRAVTINDVFQGLHREWMRMCNQQELQSSRRSAREAITIGELLADLGYYFAGLEPSGSRPDQFILHLTR
ncbi:hypothetical protein BXZ70DRAFT_1006297 [Cristinia sonorae]|uniref:DUF6699 domain-containing protein n=1 Tax=Cristinia sonorae TaxID=1940300 RepID=A0A8K0UV20_9AGAR|nr:hypothetical protein BXZ70DRAFT_1006297 [Cristinia sonorae]